MIYGIYLAKIGKTDAALEELRRAEKELPDDANLAYNLGLIYADKRDYERARAYAKQAYALGFPLPGLKQRLQRAGQWQE
jgi:tetratricopeptide (TPR) repeat protein